MSRLSAEAALPNRRAARRAFDRAQGFDDVCVVHDETRRRLLERLELTRLTPRFAVDLGCATGSGAAQLAARFPAARVLAVDSSLGMLRAARRRSPLAASVALVGGDAQLLPLCAGSVQLLFANLLLPWCLPRIVFSEAARVLSPGGLLTFATLGPDSLQEVRRAWAAVDDRIHVHAFFDMHDLGDLALAAGLVEPVMDVDRIQVSYSSLRSLVSDLRACGAVNVASGRRKSLTGARRWQAFERRLLAQGPAQRFTITLELVFGQAWGRGGPVDA
ncbi:MAG TPA: methyltransferase domain-containing protein, partial [Gammaproteobacteria bacterium]|nr:methyltransferase domain-containing protein [Gammaproteobacteria bacterium]